VNVEPSDWRLVDFNEGEGDGVNFYKRHLGDIAKATSHLSQGQMGAYDLLLDWHYSNEKPLPVEAADLHRIGRASSKIERANVDRVVAEFFTQTPDGYVQKRAVEEIGKANERAETNRRIAMEREAARRARMDHESCYETSHESCTNREPSQTPDSKEQKNQSSLRSDSPSADADGQPPIRKTERLAQVTSEAIEAFNAKLGKPNGLLPAVDPAVGIEKRRDQVKRCLKVARQICQQQFGDPRITPAFWRAYWAEVDRDEFKSGRQEGGRGHENWTPSFEYLTRVSVMLDVFDRAKARKSS
jgi:uncharacterized protein YdaU (DUF1376 family)